MKIKSPKNLIAVGILAIMLLGAHSASAYVPGIWDPQPRIQTGETAFTAVPEEMDTPVTPEPEPQVTYSYVAYNNPTPTQPTTTTTVTPTQTQYRTVTRYRTVDKVVPAPAATTSSNLPPVVSSDQQTAASGFPADTSTNNGLTALSLNGSGGFIPSSIWQWLLVIFLILIIIIIARMFKKPEAHHVAAH